MDKTKQIEGFFLEFTSEELDIVREELERQEYTPDGAGIKEFLMDNLFDMEEDAPPPSAADEIIQKAARFMQDNPATVNFGIKTVMGMMGKIGRGGPRK